MRHHKQKIAFLFSAMRHFAAELEAEGIAVDYVRLDAPGNTGSFTGELERAVARHAAGPRRRHRARRVAGLGDDAGLARRCSACPCEIRDDNRFLCSRADFARWAGGPARACAWRRSTATCAGAPAC